MKIFKQFYHFFELPFYFLIVFVICYFIVGFKVSSQGPGNNCKECNDCYQTTLIIQLVGYVCQTTPPCNSCNDNNCPEFFWWSPNISYSYVSQCNAPGNPTTGNGTAPELTTIYFNNNCIFHWPTDITFNFIGRHPYPEWKSKKDADEDPFPQLCAWTGNIKLRVQLTCNQRLVIPLSLPVCEHCF